MSLARPTQAYAEMLSSQRLYGKALEVEVVKPEDNLLERVRCAVGGRWNTPASCLHVLLLLTALWCGAARRRTAWGRHWMPDSQEAMVGPVKMKVRPSSRPASRAAISA